LKALNLAGKQKREMSNDLLDRCLLKPPEKDVLDHSFSWRIFRQWQTCIAHRIIFLRNEYFYFLIGLI
jgi:hypothetical protein